MPLTWHDQLSGPHTANVAAQLGDFIVAKGDGTPAYQLAVVVDDHAMGVTEVLRGDDLIPSTFRQLDLMRAFAWSPPSYMHVPLMIGPDGRRLAKRHGDTRLSWFRDAGYEAPQLVGYLAWSAGLLESPTRVCANELINRWSINRLKRHATVVELESTLRVLDAIR
jgi:glutamyl-tRNA synthetase